MKQIESLFLGIIAALGAMVLELVIFGSFSLENLGKNIIIENTSSLNYFVIGSVLVEEILKYLIIIKRVESFSLGRTLIINSLLVGLGFSTVEIGLIYAGNSGIQIPYGSLAEIALIHMFTAGIIGYFVSSQRPKRLTIFLKAVIISSSFHIAYNALIIYPTNWTTAAIIALLGILFVANALSLAFAERRLAS